MARNASQQTLRIIGGNWRGRKVSFAKPTISFADQEQIRPTPDRVRETLFNWLAPCIKGSHCLDLFAGSGILSIEALSRGAARVTLVDYSQNTIDHILEILNVLNAKEQTYQGVAADALKWLDFSEAETFDIVFLDPPFQYQTLYTLATKLEQRGMVRNHGLVYFETPEAVEPNRLPENWRVEKQKKAGAVHYCLCRVVH